MNEHDPAKWWENHSPQCGTQYRGCAPECPKDRFEKLLHKHDIIPADAEPFQAALDRSESSTDHWKDKIKELKRQIETLRVRLREEETLQTNIKIHLKSLEGEHVNKNKD